MKAEFRERVGAWSSLAYSEWRETCQALHLWSQIVGKYRLALTPWVNHSWHATFYPTPRGLTTGLIMDGSRFIEVRFDFREHCLVAEADSGAVSRFALEAMSVADFFRKTQELIAAVGGTPRIHAVPSEIPNAVSFLEDEVIRPYDRSAVERFHRALLDSERVMTRFRTGYLGKVSPVHLFWGALDLAVTRFSGSLAPLHPGGIPGLPDEVVREAYSHEVSSAGFWPGGSGADDAMYYSYCYPEPAKFKDYPIEPQGAYYDDTLREFLLPYEYVRRSDDPDATLMRFLLSTYAAAAECAGWQRDRLECGIGEAGVPRPLE